MINKKGGIMKKEKKQKQEQKIEINQFLDSVANTVFTNMKLHINKKFQELEPFFQTLDDTKINVATLSSLLYSKNQFTKEEFGECFRDIKESFGIVLPDGTIKGNISVTKYNFA